MPGTLAICSGAVAHVPPPSPLPPSPCVLLPSSPHAAATRRRERRILVRFAIKSAHPRPKRGPNTTLQYAPQLTVPRPGQEARDIAYIGLVATFRASGRAIVASEIVEKT